MEWMESLYRMQAGKGEMRYMHKWQKVRETGDYLCIMYALSGMTMSLPMMRC